MTIECIVLLGIRSGRMVQQMVPCVYSFFCCPLARVRIILNRYRKMRLAFGHTQSTYSSFSVKLKLSATVSNLISVFLPFGWNSGVKVGGWYDIHTMRIRVGISESVRKSELQDDGCITAKSIFLRS